jgi:6-phosphogluconolactonase
MSFLRAALAAPTGKNCFPRILVAMAIVLAGLSTSCGNGGQQIRVPKHNAYVTLPSEGSVLLLYINGESGGITVGPKTPPTLGATPTGLALLPNRQFLYAINSFANTISIFNVSPTDGTLALTGTPTQAGFGPSSAVIDPSGKYLLVTNNFGNNVSVYSIDASSGALSEVSGSPFFANDNPTEILITPSGQFVFVTNPGIGMVTAFTFSDGVLTPVPGTPIYSGAGAAALAIDSSERYLYVANAAATNPPPYKLTIGNISGFNIDPTSGALTSILGSPFTSTASSASGPTAIAVDPGGKFVYAVTSGSSDSIWCFQITPTNGQLVAVTSSPFSETAGGLYAIFDPSGGRLYIGSQSSPGIAGYTYNQSTGTPTAVSGSPFSTEVAPGAMVFSE